MFSPALPFFLMLARYKFWNYLAKDKNRDSWKWWCLNVQTFLCGRFTRRWDELLTI